MLTYQFITYLYYAVRLDNNKLAVITKYLGNVPNSQRQSVLHEDKNGNTPLTSST